MWHCANLLDPTSGSDLPLMCFPGVITVAWFIKLSKQSCRRAMLHILSVGRGESHCWHYKKSLDTGNYFYLKSDWHYH